MATGRIGTTPVLTTRWSKAPSAGTTSLSGNDDNSVSLVYSVGFEQVYRNGVLLSRGNDYTATTGTSITLIDATIAGDIIEVFANATVALTDTYTQSQANGKFINNTLTTTTGDIIYASAANTPARLGIGSADQVLKVSGGVPAWATASSGGITELASGSLSGSSLVLSSISSSYTDLRLVVKSFYGSTDAAYLTLTLNAGAGNFAYVQDLAGTRSTNGDFNTTNTRINNQTLRNAAGSNVFKFDLFNYSTAQPHLGAVYLGAGQSTGSQQYFLSGGYYNQDATVTSSITFALSAGTFSAGTYVLYGVK